MRRLILMRHAKSSWADPSQRDLDRPLNKRGRRARRAARRLDEDARATGPTWRWSRARGAPRRPGRGSSPRPAPAETSYVPELYHAGPDTMLAVLQRAADAAAC